VQEKQTTQSTEDRQRFLSTAKRKAFVRDICDQ